MSSNSLLMANNLVSFLPGFDAQERADIQDCLLLAELCAFDAFDRKKNWDGWINAYQQKLVVCGLSRTSAIDQKSAVFKKPKDFQSQAALLVARITSPRLAELAKSSLQDMFNSEHAKVFFSSWFSVGRSESFQMVPCEKRESGQIHIVICGLKMLSLTKPKPWYSWISKIPMWPLSYEMKLLLKGGGFVFDNTQYALNRDRVRKELQDRGAERIKRIPL
ncbi:hypothetical protein PSCICM_45200 [Pseudomonas cichorii]|uniref:hypothetical protein n=1 Tax=Pseudomonas cichorii TaxID=36746 RepID=UPI0019101003|nr:hypothetical protein [Pseudomonas cichorii]GFM78701.1 hypothetical protein PSCICM_45200 [Pseudomonas cichorii]